jgi:hypothetical protein
MLKSVQRQDIKLICYEWIQPKSEWTLGHFSLLRWICRI